MRKKCLLNYVAALLMMLLLSLTGCSGDDGGGGISEKGGTVEMNGVKMVIPEGAVDAELTVSPQMTTSDVLPAALPAGAIKAGKTVTISGLTYNLYEPALFSMPYDTKDLGDDDVPGVFFYDEGSKKYQMVSIKGIDPATKKVTFATTHGGKYVVMGIKGLGAELGIVGNVATVKSTTGIKAVTPVDTGFAANPNGFYHPNFGAYDSPGGSCLGMANFSVWYYNVIKTPGLYTKYKEGDPSRWADDVTARELISRAFMASSQTWAKSWMQTEYKLGPQLTGYFMILGLKLSGPMTFLLAAGVTDTGGTFKFVSGHATVVYKYDSGKFYIYDVNFPGEVVTIDWGKTATGGFQFSNYTKNAAYNPQFDTFAFEGAATLAESNQYKLLYDGAEAGWSAKDSKFNTINITSATDSKNNALDIDTDGTIFLTEQDTMTIKGTVTGGIKTAKYIIYRLNGGQRYRVTLSGNAFTINLKDKTKILTSNTLMMVATDDKFNEWNAYAGFKEVPIKIKGTVFFENAGFETGTFDKWTVETHTWQSTIPDPAQFKSTIVSVGPDPYVSSMNMVNVGKYSARINNYDPNFHISTITQTATVPKAANPQVKFYWAAVLEQPQHDPEHQPYVIVTVTDDTAGTIMYHKQYYTDDPDYTGWVPFGGGSSIPWQTITLSFSQADTGHKITVKVTAADCGYGAHGGYLYLDGDE